MAINNFRFNLDIEKEDYIPKLKVKQYDTAIFYVNLFKNSSQFSVSNETIKMFVKKSDGTIVYQEEGITLDGSTIKINVNNQAFVCAGLTYAELELKSSDGQVTSSTFLYEVKEKVGSDKAIESATDIATLDKLKKYIEDAKKELERFKNDLSKLEDLVANKDKLEGQNKEAKENIGEIEKILEDANNITSDEGKYIIGNNVVSESTNGYIQDIKLYGRSLVNLSEQFRLSFELNTTNWSKNIYRNIKTKLNVGTTYTFAYRQVEGKNDINGVIHEIVYTDNTNIRLFDGPLNSYGFKVFTPIKEIDRLEYAMRAYSNAETVNFEVMILEGDYTQNVSSLFEGIASTGNGNPIEVLSRKEDGNLIGYNDLKINTSISSTGVEVIENGRVSTDFIFVESNNQYYFEGTNNYISNPTRSYVCQYDINKKFIGGRTYFDNYIFNTLSNCKYVRLFTHAISSATLTSLEGVVYELYKGNKRKENIYKLDKKTILFKDTDNNWKPVKELRGIDLDRCDTIESNKYYKFIKSVVFNNNSGWFLNDITKTNTIQFSKILSDCEVLNNNPNVLSDKFKNKFIYGLDEEGIFISRKDSSSNGAVYLRINRNKLETPDVEGLGKWLQNNNVTMLYKVNKEEVYECLDISVRTFRNKTMLSIDSGAIEPGISYYVPTGFLSADNSISEKVETLDKYPEKNIKDINDLTSKIENDYFNINRGILTDFNSGIQEGKYYLHSTSLIPNSPPTSQTSLYGIVQVFYKNYNELFQLVALHNSELWIRFRNGHDQWNSWSKILNSQDFETQHGSNGFLKFPNGSVLQFGSGVTNNGVLRINFKLAFAKSDDIVLSGSALDPSPQTVGFRNLTTTGCELTCSWAANSVGVKWFAFGKIQ